MTTPIRPPSVDQALKAPELSALIDTFGRKPVVDGLRQTLDERRALLRDGEEADLSLPALAAHVEGLCRALLAVAPRPVFNLTGTVLHTNLGRAPLAEEAITAMTAVARHAGNLEFDLDSGKRGERDTPVAERLKRLTGAEDTLVVNNNAAAVLLLLNTLGLKREVPVSRGELIEIGGAFRMPDIMARAGCRLVEVGTTNRTYLRDFEQGLGPRTALLLKIHTSNYAIQGFTA
ncbi:MAG: L-seryl-tRNA(Sec) selenium transferase, partial [Rhodospirillaceae bacterium]|nr:L-seryl-tRNA(Sec) selenium transferase [Rhodospirillaceae bacterium]